MLWVTKKIRHTVQWGHFQGIKFHGFRGLTVNRENCYLELNTCWLYTVQVVNVIENYNAKINYKVINQDSHCTVSYISQMFEGVLDKSLYKRTIHENFSLQNLMLASNCESFIAQQTPTIQHNL